MRLQIPSFLRVWPRILLLEKRFGIVVLGSVLLVSGTNLWSATPSRVPSPSISQVVQLRVTGEGAVKAGVWDARDRIREMQWGGVPVSALYHDPADIETALTNASALQSSGIEQDFPSRRFRRDRWTIQDGLPDNKIRCLLQSRDGYVWVGTARGLVRFDGRRFSPCSVGLAGHGVDPNLSIRALQEDQEQRIWVGTPRGLFCVVSNAVIDFPGAEVLRETKINALASRPAGGVWIATEAGVWSGDRSGFRRLDIPTVRQATSLIESRDGILWIGREGGLTAVDLASLQTTECFPPKIRIGNSLRDDLTVYGLSLDSQGRLWIGSSFGGWRVPVGSRQPEPLADALRSGSSLPHQARFAEDDAGRIWATSQRGAGLGVFSSDGGRWMPISLANELKEVHCLIIDREQGIWIGSRNGLDRLVAMPFQMHSFDGVGVVKPYSGVVEAVDGALWLASSAFIAHWSQDRLTVFGTHGEAFAPFPVMSPGPEGAIRVTGGSQSIYALPAPDPTMLAWQLHVRPTGNAKRVQALSHSQDGLLYLGTQDGLQVIRPDGASSPADGVPVCDIGALLSAGLDSLWIGTKDRGLCRWSAAGFDQVVEPSASGEVISMALDRDGILWVGATTGLGGFHKGVFRTLVVDEASSLSEVAGIVEDDHGDLWLNHARGVMRIRRSEIREWLNSPLDPVAITAFGLEDGIESLEPSTSPQNVLRTRQGQLWFVKRDAFVSVDPATLPSSPLPPQVHLEDVEVGNLLVARARNEVVSVPHGSVVKLRFAVLGFDSRSQLRVEHQLEGSDQGWVESGDARVAEYGALRPGSYRFRVRARDHEGHWHGGPWLQDITVRPKFWSTPRFLVSCAIAAAGIGVGIYYRRRSREVKRAAAIRLRTLQSERSRIARDMHDHLGGKLAGLALKAGNTPHVQESVREILSELNDLVWSVDPRNDTLSGLADFIADAAAQYLAAANLRLELSMPESLPERMVQGAVRHELLAVYREALRNVVEHAKASVVKVQFSASPDFIEIVVEDDGIGFDAAWTDSAMGEDFSAKTAVPAREGGLERFRMRMRSVGGRCRIKSAAGVGTRLEFRIPLSGSGS